MSTLMNRFCYLIFCLILSLPVLSKSADKRHALQPFIIGGERAGRTEFPEFALMVTTRPGSNRRGRCGGTMIAPNKMLTAAHCILLREPDTQYLIVPQFYNQNIREQDANGIGVIDIQTHPDFDDSTAENDIAILTLQESVSTATASVFVGKDRLANRSSIAIGAGLTDLDNEVIATTLSKFDTSIIANETCNEDFNAFNSNTICVSPSLPGKPLASLCFGDSGSPLIIEINGRSVVAGIASFIDDGRCTAGTTYAGYARTSSYLQFIRQHSPETKLVYATSTFSLNPTLDLLLSE